jgi:hypothetical protein
MMVFALLIVIIGFIISLVTLLTKKLENNNKVKKFLAGLYILLCVVSGLLLILNSINDKKSSFKLFKELSEIGSSVKLQSDTLQLVLTQTVKLSHRLESNNIITKNIIEQRERSQKISQEQNKILEKSNELAQKRIYAERPEVVVIGSEIIFKSIDSSNSVILINFRNMGKRTASKFLNRVVLAVKNKDGNYSGLTEIPEQQSINSSFINSASYIEQRINLNLGFEQIKNLISGGTIIIYYKYYDEILNDYEHKETRFDFTNDWYGNNILSNEDATKENGLDDYLKRNIKNPY